MEYKERKIFSYLQSLYDQKEGSFRFSRFSESTILSTDFAVSTLHLLNDKEFLSQHKEAIINFLMQSAKENNLFVDKEFSSSDLVGKIHKEDYITYQFTFFSLIALDILGKKFDTLSFFFRFSR